MLVQKHLKIEHWRTTDPGSKLCSLPLINIFRKNSMKKVKNINNFSPILDVLFSHVMTLIQRFVFLRKHKHHF